MKHKKRNESHGKIPLTKELCEKMIGYYRRMRIIINCILIPIAILLIILLFYKISVKSAVVAAFGAVILFRELMYIYRCRTASVYLCCDTVIDTSAFHTRNYREADSLRKKQYFKTRHNRCEFRS